MLLWYVGKKNAVLILVEYKWERRGTVFEQLPFPCAASYRFKLFRFYNSFSESWLHACMTHSTSWKLSLITGRTKRDILVTLGIGLGYCTCRRKETGNRGKEGNLGSTAFSKEDRPDHWVRPPQRNQGHRVESSVTSQGELWWSSPPALQSRAGQGWDKMGREFPLDTGPSVLLHLSCREATSPWEEPW